MYNDLFNQIATFSQFSFAFIFLYMLLPRLIFRATDGLSGLDKLAANYMRMVFLMILLGYALVIIKLWEVISILTVLFILAGWNSWSTKSASEKSLRLQKWAVFFFDWTESRQSVIRSTQTIISRYAAKTRAMVSKHLFEPASWLFLAAFTAVFGISAFIRFYDSFHSLVPAMSDGYVTLAWMKYIDGRILFNDGIYPLGSHIYLDSLHKFAFIDAIYILKYAGPLNSTFIVLSLYYAVSRFSGNRWAGLVASAVYGLFGQYLLGGGWERQAATNSQEFAFIFVLPALYFFYRYLKEGKRADLWTAFAGTAVSGLVHTVAFALAGLGVGVLLTVFLLTGFRQTLSSALRTAAVSLGAVLVSLLPYGIGLLMKIPFNQAAFSYVTTTQPSYGFSSVSLWDKITLVLVALVFLAALIAWKWRRTGDKGQVYMFTALFGGSMFMIYYAGAHFTGSELIATRSADIWVLVIPFGLGIGASLLFDAFRYVSSKEVLAFSFLTLFLAAGFYVSPPQPIVPYKLQREDDVDQYLRISHLYRPKTWMIVSSQQRGYDLALGTGNFMMTEQFMSQYDPVLPALTQYGKSKTDEEIAHEIFLYEHKDIFRVSKENVVYALLEPEYKQQELDMAGLKQWIAKYEKAHGKLEIFYDGPHLRIYHIHTEESREEIQQQIWGS